MKANFPCCESWSTRSRVSWANQTFLLTMNTYFSVCIPEFQIIKFFILTGILLFFLKKKNNKNKDSWIVDYLTYCAQPEQEKCLQLINKLFTSIATNNHSKQLYPDQHQKIMSILFKHILPLVKQIYRQSNVFGGVPDISASFCIHATGQCGMPTFQDLFTFFTESTCCDIQ